jgi:hypothetical protein
MAKGNDGNLLQHTVEVEAAAYLLDQVGGRRLYLVSTHAMAPFESFDGTAKARTATRIGSKLRVATSVKPTSEGYPLIVRSYAGVQASDRHYPNTATLLDWVCKTNGAELNGVLVDVDAENASALRETFPGMTVADGSWRTRIADLAPPDLECPWLFSMDPMKFTSGAGADDDRMSRSDVKLLLPVWSSYFNTGLPGVVAVFSYSMRNDERRSFVKTIAEMVLPALPSSTAFGLLEAKNYTSDYHVAAIVASERGVLDRVRNATLGVFGTNARDHDNFPTEANIFEHIGGSARAHPHSSASS